MANTSTTYLSTAESFIVIASDSSAYIPQILTHIRNNGLKIRHQRNLYLNEILSERLLRAILLDSSSSSSSSSSAATVSHSDTHSSTLPKTSDVSITGNTVGGGSGGKQNSSSSSVLATTTTTNDLQHTTQKRFGSTVMGASTISGTLSRQYNPVRPTVDECETFSTLAGPLTVITITCVDPRVNVVTKVSDLVNNNIQRQYPSRTGIIEILAPSVPSQAVKALHLLEEYYIRQEANSPTILTSSSSSSSSSTVVDPVTSSSSSSVSLGASALNKSYLVDMDTLHDFLFPPHHQHSMSTGRLVLFALYGPLTNQGHLTGGIHHHRILTESEILTMVKEIEQDDILAVYTAGSVKGDINEVLTDVQAYSRGYPRMTRIQIEQMLTDLPRDSRGRCSFHDIQKRVLGSRLQRIEDMRKMFPNITKETDEKLTATRITAPPKSFGRGKLSVTRALANGHSVGTNNGNGNTSKGNGSTGLASLTSASGLDVRVKVGEVAAVRLQETLLHRNTCRVAEIQDATRSGLIASMAANTKIVRSDIPGAYDNFDRSTIFRLYPNTGTRIPGSVSKLDFWRPSVVSKE